MSGSQPAGPDTAVRNLFASLGQDSSSFSDALQPSDVSARIVSNSVVSQASMHIPSMPWETGPTKAIFCDSDVNDSNLNVPLENAFREDHFQSEPGRLSRDRR